MKIYQIHKSGDDNCDYIVGTYLKQDKAIEKKSELEIEEEIKRKCGYCPLEYCPSDCKDDCSKCTKEDMINRAKVLCDKCDVEKIEDDNYDNGYYIKCKNKLLHFDDSYFRIEEVDVI